MAHFRQISFASVVLPIPIIKRLQLCKHIQGITPHYPDITVIISTVIYYPARDAHIATSFNPHT